MEISPPLVHARLIDDGHTFKEVYHSTSRVIRNIDYRRIDIDLFEK